MQIPKELYNEILEAFMPSKMVKEYLNGDEQKGEDLWERLNKFDGMSAEQLLKVLEEKQ